MASSCFAFPRKPRESRSFRSVSDTSSGIRVDAAPLHPVHVLTAFGDAMKSSRRELLLLCLAGAAGGSLSLTPAAARAAARDELVGTWLVENSADKHEWKDVQSLTLQADGSAIKRFKSSTFAKRWSLSK